VVLRSPPPEFAPADRETTLGFWPALLLNGTREVAKRFPPFPRGAATVVACENSLPPGPVIKETSYRAGEVQRLPQREAVTARNTMSDFVSPLSAPVNRCKLHAPERFPCQVKSTYSCAETATSFCPPLLPYFISNELAMHRTCQPRPLARSRGRPSRLATLPAHFRRSQPGERIVVF